MDNDANITAILDRTIVNRYSIRADVQPTTSIHIRRMPAAVVNSAVLYGCVRKAAGVSFFAQGRAGQPQPPRGLENEIREWGSAQFGRQPDVRRDYTRPRRSGRSRADAKTCGAPHSLNCGLSKQTSAGSQGAKLRLFATDLPSGLSRSIHKTNVRPSRATEDAR